MDACFCGSKKLYDECCEVFISGKALPTTPEQLMRSRYSAYVSANISYIEQTMQGPAALNFNPILAEQWAKSVVWLGLKVIKSNRHNDKGYVEFIATYTDNGVKQKIHEVSQFRLIDGRWYYLSGKQK